MATRTTVISSFLLGLALALAGAVRAGSIKTEQPPVATLSDGRAGVVAFLAPAPKSARELVERSVGVKSIITGLLKMPPGAHGPVPAMVIVHGSGGVGPGEWDWANRMNALGIASFVIDNFTGRGVEETETDQFRLSPTADIAGALAALRLLATHPGIDPKRIGVVGFSRGGIVALDTALEPFRQGVIDGDLRFAVHIPFYPSCDINFVSAHLDGSPILMLLGGKDNYTPAPPCLAFADELRDKGVHISVVVYPDAYHAFDLDIPLEYFKESSTARNCQGRFDLDTGTFTMRRGDVVLTGKDALAEVKQCFTTGVNYGGDPEGREKAPVEVAAFLKATFGL
jgi:dienelactone hydrolase